VLTLEAFCEAVDGRTITVRAVCNQRDTGMRLTRDGLEWRLLTDLTEDYAEMVDVLTSSESGHQYLEARGSNITVEVSIGEYPETLGQTGESFEHD
jgi:hypothetical protein